MLWPAKSGECQRKLHIKIANNVPLKKWHIYSITHSALPQIRVCILHRHMGACRHTSAHTHIILKYILTHTSLCRHALLCVAERKAGTCTHTHANTHTGTDAHTRACAQTLARAATSRWMNAESKAGINHSL